MPNKQLVILATAILSSTLAHTQPRMLSGTESVKEGEVKIVVSSPKLEFPRGGVPIFQVTITNLTGHELRLFGDLSGLVSALVSYKSELINASGEPAAETKLGRALRTGKDEAHEFGGFIGNPGYYNLPPGHSSSDGLDLQALYKIEIPGQYRLQVTRFFSGTKFVVKSNVLTFTVTE